MENLQSFSYHQIHVHVLFALQILDLKYVPFSDVLQIFYVYFTPNPFFLFYIFVLMFPIKVLNVSMHIYSL